MKANELRIGNWVSVNFGNRKNGDLWLNKTIEAIVLNSYEPMTNNYYDSVKLSSNNPNNNWFNIDSIKPIPLTEEWLLKFGFEKKVLFGQDFIGRKIEITQYELDYYTITMNKETFNFCIEDCLAIREIQYVHQLQNLYFALTGEELTA